MRARFSSEGGVRWARACALRLGAVLAMLAADVAVAVELRDAELVAAGEPALESTSGTLRLEDARLGRLGPPVFLPEPGASGALLAGAALLALLAWRRGRRRGVAPGVLALLATALVAAPVPAQVPEEATFTGRLVDGSGSPLAGPVDLELRVFDAETSGTPLYTEEHLGVVLDATGGFSVQLGQGSSPSGAFDAALFSEPDRWLEVVVGTEVLAPRRRIGAVPWALVARQANEIVPDPSAPRFEDCGDGTVADRETGLLWEKKTGSPGLGDVSCESVDCPDPHYVNNEYAFTSSGGSMPDGGIFEDFLPRLNGQYDPKGATGCFADRCDWRLPTIAELQTILIGPEAAPGQASTCSVGFGNPCVDPDFAAVGGPTEWDQYWAPEPANWAANFQGGTVFLYLTSTEMHVRAVRTGSCH